MAKFYDSRARVADKGVMVHDGFSVGSWRAIRAMKDVGLLVREGGDKGGKRIVNEGRPSTASPEI